MSDFEPTPDDLVVSAVLDGVASPDEVERVAADPVLTARLARFRSVADAVGAPVAPVDRAVREAHLTRALGEAVPAGMAGPPAPPPATPPQSPPAGPPIDLAAARARRHHRPRHVAVLSAAAVVVLLVAVAAFLTRAADPGEGGGDDEVAATDRAAFESSGATGADATEPLEPETGPVPPAAGAAVAGPASTVAEAPAADSADTANGAESALGATLPDLGRFTEAAALVTRVRLELASGARDLAADEPCRDDFAVPVMLLGRASVGGAAGLVYVETAPAVGRRVWLVAADQDSDTPGGGCRQIIPVQSL